jgi:hypothetical protein
MDRTVGIIIFAMGVFILLFGRSLSIGTLQKPGPGFFPLVIACALMGLSLILIFSGPAGKGKKPLFVEKVPFRVLSVFLVLVAYFLVLEYLGFIVTSFLLMLYLFRGVDSQGWFRAAAGAFLSTGLAYLIFEILMQGNLPKGMMGLG